MLARALTVGVLLGALSVGCRPATDLGKECVLTKRGPDGGPVDVMETEIKIGLNKDFISFGSAVCEDLVCVRDAQYKRPISDAGVIDPALKAKGYCSRPCIENGSCPAADPGDDERADKKLTCRALLLDAETLAAICDSDLQTCKTYFGETKSPFFCARGTKTDAGM